MIGTSIKNRYSIRAVLGQGGMGVVYHAFDTVMRRDVAVKTLRDVPTGAFLDLFSRECSVLAAMVHPNVVEIFDMGEFDEGGVSKPYFVMPLLPGSTLHDLIYGSTVPLSPVRCLDIVTQACRGLQAAHEQQLIHQDIKPRNIFVMRGDAVKLIDFGVAHLSAGNSTGVRGTLKYMSPEQLTFKGLTYKSDIFSLAVVCYEALTAAHPFLRRPNRDDPEDEIANAVINYLPPLASELNPAVNRSTAQVVAKGMAKDTWNRPESAASFAEALQKAMYNDGSGVTTKTLVRSRIDRARRSFEEKDLQFASEILNQLEAEGHSDPEITEFRGSLNSSVQRERCDRLLDAAERFFVSDEHALALGKIQEVIELDATNGAAAALKRRIEGTLTEQKIAKLLKIAADHLERSDFTNARYAVQDALKLRPSDTRSRQLLSEVDTRQKEILRQRQERERLYQSAQTAFFAGKIELALENLGRLDNLIGQSGESVDQLNGYKELNRRVHFEHDALKAALAQAEALLDHDLTAAQKICDRYLTKYPDPPGFIALSEEIERRRKELELAFRRDVIAKAESEDSLDARLRIFESALKSHPNDEVFPREIDNLRSLIRTIGGIETKARALENENDFRAAKAEWESIRAIYPRLPGLDEHITRVHNSFERLRAERLAALVSTIQDGLAIGSFDVAGDLLAQAEIEFPQDTHLSSLRERLETQVEQAQHIAASLTQAQSSSRRQDFKSAFQALARAAKVAEEVPYLLRSVFDESLAQAQLATKSDWRLAKAILDQAAELQADLSIPATYWEAIAAQRRDDDVIGSLDEAAQSEAANDLLQAQTVILHALERCPGEKRLQSRLSAIDQSISDKRRKEERESDLRHLRTLLIDLSNLRDSRSVHALLAQSRTVSERYRHDAEVTSLANEIASLFSAFEAAAAALKNDDDATCNQICGQVLADHPDHGLFLDLRDQAEALRRQKTADYLEQVAHQLASEPDLARRREVLEIALQKYPDEQYFSGELALVLDKQALVQAIADRARTLEDDGLIPEALAEWHYLRTVYPLHPEASRSIERCNNLIHQRRARDHAVALAAIDKALNDQNYREAAERLRDAQSAFPKDPAFQEIERLIAQRIASRNLAIELLQSAEEAFLARDFRSGLDQIKKALTNAIAEADLKNAIASTLIRQTEVALSYDVATAESLLAEAKLADPAVAVQKKLETTVLEARANLDLTDLLAHVDRLEAVGDFIAALDLTRRFLTKYPGNVEAAARQEALLKAKAETERRYRCERALSDLASLRDQAQKITSTKKLSQLLKRVEEIANANTSYDEVVRAAGAVGGLISAYQQLQQLADSGRLQEAEELCQQTLAAFPDDATLAAWSAEIEHLRNEKASEYLRQVERRLADEPNLLKQEQILLAAIREFPKESYYPDELTLVRNKQLLLEAEIARARSFEFGELYDDAAREWEGLRKAYPWYAGIDQELDRLYRAIEAQIAAVRNGWVAKINDALSATDVDLADSILIEASAELPRDPVLETLRSEIEKVRNALQERSALASRARQAFAGGLLPDGAALLVLAVRIFPKDIEFRGSVVNVLLNEARGSVESNWQVSELLIQEITQIHPDFSVPSDLDETFVSKKRESEIALLLQKVDHAQSIGDLEAGKRLLDAGFTRFPDEQAIIDRRNTVIALLHELAAQKARENARLYAVQVRSQIQLATSKRKLVKLRSEYLAHHLVDSPDSEIAIFAGQLLAEIDQRLADLATAPKIKPKISLLWYVAITIACAAGLVATLVLRKPPAPKKETISVALAPQPPAIRIAGNMPAGDVYLDDVKVGSLLSGSLNLPQPSDGAHVLRLSGKEGVARIPIFQDSQAGPRVNAPISGDDISVTTISTNAKTTGLTTNIAGNQAVFLDNKGVGSTSRSSLALPVLQPGNHHLQMGKSENATNFDLLVPAAPSLTVLIANATTTGRLDVATNVSGADLFVDGKKYSTAADRTFHLILPAKTYELQLEHEGYLRSDSAHVNIIKGSQVSVDLKLLPKTALLQIPAVVSGTEIKLDGTSLAKFISSKPVSRSVIPGSHTLEITRRGFVSKQLQRTVDPGQTIVLAEDDLNLSPIPVDLVEIEDRAWREVQGTRNVANLRAFVQRFPKGQHTQTANQMLQQFEWDAVEKSSGSALANYIAGHSDGLHSTEARQLAEQIAKSDDSRREQNAWNSIDKRNKGSIQDFLRKYPNGAHAILAQQTVAELTKAEEQIAQQGVEEAAWRSVNKTDRSSIDAYLNRFPTGIHAGQARDALTDLSRKPAPSSSDSAGVVAVLQEFAAAWSSKDLSTIMRLQPSLTRRELRTRFENVRSWTMKLTPLGTAQIAGDRASITCRREIGQTFADGTKIVSPTSTVTYFLRNQASGWIIEGFK